MTSALAASSSSDSETPYAMQVLMEELATLRKRNKELEDDRSGMTFETDSSGSELHQDSELAALRKELLKVSDSKAAQELEFMNQLSQMAREGGQENEDLRIKLGKTQEELKSVKKQQSASISPSDEKTLIGQLQQDLKSADRELEVNRKDVEDLYKKNRKLEAQKTALIAEVTELRVEVDNENKVTTSMHQAMEENDKHLAMHTKKLENELIHKNALIKNHNQELGEMNDGVIKLESQRAMLLDEITDLRMQLDRAEDSKHAAKKKMEEVLEQQKEQQRMMSSSSTGIRVGALMQSTSDAQEKAAELEDQVSELQKELRSVTTAYKKDSSKWEEMSSFKDLEVQKAQESLDNATRATKKAQLEVLAREDSLAQVKTTREEDKRTIAELQQELTALKNQRVSFEKKSTQSIHQHVTQVDEALEHNKVLESQLEALKQQMGTDRAASSQLKLQVAELKNANKTARLTSVSTQQRTGPPLAAPLSPPLSPQPYYGRGRNPSFRQQQHPRATSPASQPESTKSDGTNSVRALAAAFDQGGEAFHKGGPSSPPLHKATRGETRDGPVPTAVAIQAYPAADVDDLHSQIQELEEDLQDTRAQNELLTQKLQQQCELVGELQAEVTTLSASRTAIQQLSRKEYEKESQESTDKIRELQNELEEGRQQVIQKTDQVDKLKCEIRAMTCERLAYEECTMEAYEKRAVTSQKSYQGEVNQLQVELTNAQVKYAKMEKDYMAQTEKMDMDIEHLNAECDAELENKQGELDVIQYRLDEQKDMVEKLTKEREQLCLQMNDMSSTRRDEIADLQSELMETKTQNTSLNRAMQALQMQVEHHEGNTRELKEMKERVKEVESKPGGNGTIFKNQVELETLSDETKKLREMVRNLTLERRGLQEKVNAVVTDKKDSRTLQVLRDRNEKLRREVDRLTKKIEKIEGSVTRIAI